VSSARNKFSAWAIAAALAISALSCAPAPPTTQSAVETQLTCQCGCGLTVHSCNHLQCSFAIPVREDIAASLAKDESGTEIVARYAREYGEKVLSAPIREGFNLLAWYGPYIALFGAGFIVVMVIRRWTPERIAAADRDSANTSGEKSADELSGTDRDRLRDELEDYDP
jgi:cytochrome c-type biogenesis protein CcmH